mmetsp:Transcript_36953/g.124921  ORF Transcript_36953/g.124921 Transcript_36953/m.124921 type:complete len:179 (-) Transcript_36953:313-849(-)
MNTHDLTKREFCDVIGTPIVALLDPPCLDLAIIPEMGTDIVDSDVEDDGMSSEERRLDQSTSTLYAELMEVDESHVTRSSRPKLRDWLLAFYSEHNRCKIDEIDTIMERYKGREASLVRNLEKKYAPPRYKEALDETVLLPQNSPRESGSSLRATQVMNHFSYLLDPLLSTATRRNRE